MTAPTLPDGITVLERGWLSSNSIVFTRGTLAVVDTGYATHAPQTVALIGAALEGRAPAVIANTHLHSDHCGGNASLQRAFPHARTLLPPGQAAAVAAWDEDALSYAATGQSCERFRFDALLVPGERTQLGDREWHIHAAPGHDPHSVVLFEPSSRALISADALWENGFGVVFPELDGEPGFGEVGATLDVIERLHPLIVLPGHGAPFGGEAAIAQALARARSRLAAFVADPRRHASHAMKVLIKFKLLEWQRVDWGDFLQWADAMPYLKRVHALQFAAVGWREWLTSLVEELVRGQALRRDGALLCNI